MFDKLRKGRQKYGLKRYFGRQWKGRINRIFYRSELDDLIAGFHAIGARKGMTFCVHSSLSRLGYIDGGADTIIDALQSVVGDDGCILMPAFSMGGDMESHLREAETFDARNTRSSVGLIPEIFRRRNDVLRSCHPTNSVCAWGSGAEELLVGHETSNTPFGHDTPYGRLANRDDAYILMLDTHLHSLLHHIQERVQFPNLFLANEVEVPAIDQTGQEKTVHTKVMRRRIPYYVAIDGAAGGDPDWAILHDYALMFPSRRADEVRRLGYSFNGFPVLYRRRTDLEAAGILRSGTLGRGEIGLLRIVPFLQRIQPEMEGLIEKYNRFYDVQRLDEMNLPYS